MNGSSLLLIMLSCCMVGLLLTATVAEAAPGDSNRYIPNIKHDFRSRRGFKTFDMATARGFGKRSSLTYDYDDNNVDQIFPVEWLVEYLQKKPEALRYLVERMVDRNGDGQISSSEIVSTFQD